MIRVAIVHDWLTGMRGGERVLESLLEFFPNAEIFTLFHHRGSVSPLIESRPIHTSPLQYAPFTERNYRYYLPLYPLAMRGLRIRGFDLVISSSHCVAKAARSNGTPHLCYCHTPMRYVWDQFDAYVSPRSWKRLPAAAMAAALRSWDASTAHRVDAFVANSAFVRDRIRLNYGRDAAVVHPPIRTERFGAARDPHDFYLVVSALVPYKRVDLAIAACARLGRRLVIAGDGPEGSRLRSLAGPSVTFLGRVSDEEVAELYSRCRAFLFPGVEDFGITAVEAQAAGAPVIALAEGGALETVVGPIVGCSHDPSEIIVTPLRDATGIFFAEPTVDGLAHAILAFERMEFDECSIRMNAERFTEERFHEGMLREIVALLSRGVAAIPEPLAAV